MQFRSKSLLLFMSVAICTVSAFAQVGTDSDSLQVQDLSALQQKANPYNIPEEILPLWDSLSIRQKAAQLIMVYMSPSDFLVKNEFGGVLVMKSHLNKKDNFVQNLAEANAQLRIPLLVASDQEGGRVNRIGGISEKWKTAPSAKQMREMDTDSIEAIAYSIGQELKELGINLNLAPVLDPAQDHRKKNSFMEESHRSWDNDDSEEKIAAFVRGMKANGISCVSKHFPGYDSWTNSDHQIAISATPKAQIRRNVGLFKAQAERIPITMMSSVRFIRISSKPAVFEPKIVKMARDMSDDIVVLTDDLWGTSLRAWISGKERATGKNYPAADFKKLVRVAVMAGNDMFMITFPRKAEEMVTYLERLAKYNKTYKKRIEESAARIIKMKYKAGILKAN